MALKHTHGEASDYNELVSHIIDWTTDATIHGDDAWELMQNKPFPYGTILKAHGRQAGTVQYIGLMPNTIVKGHTYRNWFMTWDKLCKYFVYCQEQGLKLKNGMSFKFDGNTITPFPTGARELPNPTIYSFPETPDIFESNANILSFGVFKQYSKTSTWDEQPGGCYTHQNSLNLLPIRYTSNTGGSMRFRPPPLPGCEAPALSYGMEGFWSGKFEYWLIKDARRLIIVTHDHGKWMDATDTNTRWEFAYIGQFDPYDYEDEYRTALFPAIIASTTAGTVSVGKEEIGRVGARYDYDPSHWGRTHGLPSLACIPDDGVFGQVRYCDIRGNWQNANNFKQVVTRSSPEKNRCYGVSSSTPVWVRMPPTVTTESHRIAPHDDGLRKDWVHTLYDGENSEYAYLEPLTIRNYAENAPVGVIPYLFAPTGPAKGDWEENFGVMTIEGKKFLSIPDIWGGREWHYSESSKPSEDHNDLAREANEKRVARRHLHLFIRMED